MPPPLPPTFTLRPVPDAPALVLAVGPQEKARVRWAEGPPRLELCGRGDPVVVEEPRPEDDAPRVHTVDLVRVGLLVGTGARAPRLCWRLVAKGLDLLLLGGAPACLGPARALEYRLPVAVLGPEGVALHAPDGSAADRLSLCPEPHPASWGLAEPPAWGRTEFSVLLHTPPDAAPHYDLCVEHGDGLLTWQLPAPPEALAGEALVAALPAHRFRYLAYSGPLSGGRGSVRTHDRGQARLERTADGYRVGLEGGRFTGTLTLRAGPWRLSVEAGDAP